MEQPRAFLRGGRRSHAADSRRTGAAQEERCGIPLQSAYCAAKHAIQGFTESVRCELIHDKSNVKITMVQMPALNTPQFTRSKSRMPRKAQPVPPIYQPEVAGDAIVWAAHHSAGSGTLAARPPSS
jgi:NAD(P)-dependent dehydrogenase (short-subunit alcohol dehydrogenase family)